MSVGFYQGYGHCKRCGDRWPILYRLNPFGRSIDSDQWLVVEGWMGEDEHEQLHQGGLAARARLWSYKLARILGFRLAEWPDEVGR